MPDASNTIARPLHVRNAVARPTLGPEAGALMSEADHRAAMAEITSWPGYAPTPIVDLPGLARAAGVAAIGYKDEGQRFELASFKALGGAYAVLRVLQEKLAAQGVHASAADLVAGNHRDLIADQVMVCATDGNHGRSVAWGARMFGCKCRIYIHEHVSADREAAIAAFGAVMVRLPGDYDASVRAAAQDADAQCWNLVADTNAGGGSDAMPRLVTQGYTVIVAELVEQLATPPTHVFVPAGVGGLAAAIAGSWARVLGAARPRVVVVEPHAANCVFRAVAEGAPRSIEGDVNSFMACLSAGSVSPVAWPVIRDVVDDVVTIADETAVEMLRALATGRYGDAPLVSGESGCASVAAVLAVANDPALRATLGIKATSRIVAIGSEGATAPEVWRAVTGFAPEEVLRNAPRSGSPAGTAPAAPTN
jgi:diaminopropionate ammonia-lyase